MRHTTTMTILGLAFLAVGGTHAEAQELEDGRWLPYLGCWVDAEAPESPLTCVVPEGPGVSVVTVVDGEVMDRRSLHAGEGALETELPGCSGTESVLWSADGHRLFTEARLTCAGTERRTRGIIAMVEPTEWIEVRALAGEPMSPTWVKRYRLAPAERFAATGLVEAIRTAPVMLEAARVAAAGRVAIEDLVEAHAGTHPEAVRSWIVEQGDPLRLDAEALLRLADAGVAPEVIDVAVAVSFPDRFDVARESTEARGRRGVSYGYGAYGAYGAYGPYRPFGPYYYDPFYYRYNSLYGYGYGYYGTGWMHTTPTVIVVSSGSASSGGQVVKGRGYRSGSVTGGTARSSVRGSPAGASTSSRGYQGSRATSSSSSSGSKGKAKPRGGGG